MTRTDQRPLIITTADGDRAELPPSLDSHGRYLISLGAGSVLLGFAAWLLTALSVFLLILTLLGGASWSTTINAALTAAAMKVLSMIGVRWTSFRLKRLVVRARLLKEQSP